MEDSKQKNNIYHERIFFCQYCGTQLDDGACFCKNCGRPIQERKSGRYKTREYEYAGKIIKCPSCNEEISSFMAFCPSCGHEINSAEVSTAIKDFSNQISQCDIAIANSSSNPKSGWKSWGKWKKVGWVFLNIYTLCIPLMLYLLLPFLGIVRASSLTPEEKTKAQLINNFPFPNERESILEALLYIKAQMESLASGKIDRSVAYWIRIWKNKASQLFNKAEIMFKNDKIANDAYSAILASEQNVKKTLFTRVLIAAAIVIIYIVFLFVRGGVGESIKKEVTPYEWPTSGIALQIPEPSSNKGKITFNDDENFWLEVQDIDQGQYESYINDCKTNGFTIEGEKDSSSYEAYNDAGYHLTLFYSESSNELSIQVEAPESMNEIQWPQSDIAKRLPNPKSSYGRIEWEADYGFIIYLGNTTKKDFLNYADACYDAGFKVEYEKGDTYFRADDSDGYHVDIEYRGNNVMFVSIDEPD